MMMLRLAWRDLWRIRPKPYLGFILFLFAATSSAFFSTAREFVIQAVKQIQRQHSGADFEIQSQSPIPSVELDSIRNLLPKQTEETEVKEFLTMAVNSSTGASKLVDAKAIDGPLVRLRSAQADTVPIWRDPQPSVWIDSSLSASLNAGVGSFLQVGNAKVKVTGILAEEPGNDLSITSLGPRIWLSSKTLALSGLDQFGSRMRIRRLFRVESRHDADKIFHNAQSDFKVAFPQSTLRWFTPEQSSPQLRNVMTRFEEMLGALNILITVFLLFGLMSSLQSHFSFRRRILSLYRALGFSGRKIFVLYTLQITLFFGAMGIVATTLLHAAAVRLFLPQFASLAELPYRAPDLSTHFSNIVSTCLTSTLLGVLLLLIILAPKQSTVGKTQIGLGLVSIIGILLAIDNSRIVLPVLAAAFTIFFFTAKLLFLWLSRFSKQFRNFARFLPDSAIAVSLLSIATATLFTLLAIHISLRDELGRPNSDQPRFFSIDLRPENRATMESLIRATPGSRVIFSPWYKGRLKDKEINFTERSTLYNSEKILQGSTFNDSEAPEVSLEQGFAKRNDITLGSVLRIEIQNRVVQPKVTSIRAVRWTEFTPNFFIVLKPGLLKGLAHTEIGAIFTPDLGFQDRVARALPHVTVFNIRSTLDRLSRIADQFLQILMFFTSVTFLISLIVLTLFCIQRQLGRRFENSVLKCLGATPLWFVRRESHDSAFLAITSTLFGMVTSAVIFACFVGPRFQARFDFWNFHFLFLMMLVFFFQWLSSLLAVAITLKQKPHMVLKQ